MFGEEQPYDVLTASKEGSYWDLVAPYTIDSGVFGVGDRRQRWLIEYLQQHGGIAMGMIRCRPNGQFWVNKSNLNDLYGRRYTLALLRNDDVEKALVSFYGKLAQGCTRDTFYGGEGSCLVPVDEFGRQVFLPPNSASNGFFLWMLRYLLVQDWDLDDDGEPETLRLMYATPRHWLADGNRITVTRAPSAFGELSFSVRSHLSRGEILVELIPPPQLPKRMLFRVRVPSGWKVTAASSAESDLPVDPRGTVDLSNMRGKLTIRFEVKR